MSGFKYDVVTLIELVKSKPCIWDKTHKNNKSKILRDESWQRIFEFLEADYDNLSETEKKKTGEIIVTKWCNLRDAFLKSLKTKTLKGKKKPYKYSEHLRFLLKDQEEASFNQSVAKDDTNEFEEFTESQLSAAYSQCPVEPMSEVQTALSISPSTSVENLSKSKRPLDDVKREILTELKRSKGLTDTCSSNFSSSYHQLSDQEILLLSFLPYLRDMDELELMDFQMKVLSTIREIKEQRV